MTNTHNVVLAHSPFLGPASLKPLADQLNARGVTALVPDLRRAVTDPPVHQRLVSEFASAVPSAPTTTSLVLVGHSGAGPLLPAFAESADHPVAALTYLDAELPTPGHSWEETAPAALVDELRSQVRDSRLPPWHRWFDADLLAGLVPDDALRTTLIDEEPEVAAAFLAEPRPEADWAGPADYIQLSRPYATASARAAQRGWPVHRVDTHHLAPMTEPATIADTLLDSIAAVAP
ncbi:MULTISPECIES: hypothetical protein [Prauserella salsuginis group]|uniref:Alpha/beta hydrolase family protein n=1 Tax=Prauserella salsuginis TaxID=387889 RepID=A0ABW6G842_9PSEU|nr:MULTISPECIES: hypothetical protein [Prauserella salsuginis group]MCR3721753.1 Alpha/beta hydrolase family [Prauserella flava]MCR3734444.1 Alpha/beta hydrolase family [Prauserella salsuginis]